jgi:hypothetical protein
MPIKGVSDKRQLPRIGKIRLGVKVQNQKKTEYPKAVDYFVVNEDPSTPGWAVKAFKEVYGDKPRELDVMLPTNERDAFFPQFYRRYGSGSGLLCKGDGETAFEVNKDTGEMVEIVCDPTECEWYAKKHCRMVGTLQFLLPRVNGLGVWVVDTSSYHSIVNLNSAIEFIKGLTGGRIALMPLKMNLVPKEVQVDGKKKIIHVLEIAHDQMRLEDVLRDSRKSAAQLLLPQVDLDTPPDDLYPEAAAAIEEEEQQEEEKPTTKAGTQEEALDALQETMLNETKKAIGELYKYLKTPPAKQKAVLASAGDDPAKLKALLKALEDEVTRRKGESKEKAPDRATPEQAEKVFTPTPEEVIEAEYDEALQDTIF